MVVGAVVGKEENGSLFVPGVRPSAADLARRTCRKSPVGVGFIVRVSWLV